MLTCHDIARYFLAQVNEDEGDLISNLKLQKLAYYAQGFHLAIYDSPLFNEEIHAWTHGPVIPDMYHYYKIHGSGPIEIPNDVDFSKYPKDTRQFLDQVYAHFGQYSAWKLREETHKEPTWRNVSETSGVITHEAMKEYFSTQISENG